MPETESRPGAPTLEDREKTVLAELAREVDAWVTFQGLRRQLGVHQQALSRTLRRLEASGLVAHDGKGYQLTDTGAAALQGAKLDPVGKSFTVMEALLPPQIGSADVAAHLSRRWFGGLRWYAQSEAPGETSLHWVAEPGKGRVTVRVAGGALTLQVTDPQSRELLGALRPILAAVSELYGISSTPDVAHAFGESLVGLAG